MLHDASVEQQLIVESIGDMRTNKKKSMNNNLMIDSVAGSGKTTTALHIAKKYHDVNILLITYNAKLKINTRQRAEQLGLTNLTVHSYHSFCVGHYDINCYTDKGIIQMLKSNDTEMYQQPNFKILILDEAQDMSALYYELVCKIYRDNNKHAKIIVMGDKYQSIYKFNNADNKFLILAEHIFQFNNYGWKTLKLSETYRTTKQIAKFVNMCLLNSDRIISHKSGDKPRYLFCNIYANTSQTSKLYNEVKYYLGKGYKYDDIFILAPSIRPREQTKSPTLLLSNLLASNKIPVYYPNTDEGTTDEKIIKDKIAFSTFHQVKGLERKVVIVMMFDDAYFKYYNKKSNYNVCPNEIYVATTRSLECLTVVHNCINAFLPFINKPMIDVCCDKIGMHVNKVTKTSEKPELNILANELTKYVSSNIISECLEMVQIIQTNTKSTLIDIPCVSKQNSTYEDVSDINTVAIPAYFEYKTHKRFNSEFTKYWNEYINENQVLNDGSSFNDINRDVDTYKLLYISNVYIAYKYDMQFKLKQITNYKWLSSDSLIKTQERLNGKITKQGIFEVFVETIHTLNIVKDGSEHEQTVTMTGSIDCIDGNNVWKFRCANTINDDNVLQMCVLIFMYRYKNKNKTDNNKYYIYNILDDSQIEIKATNEDLENIVNKLIVNKYFNDYIGSEQFIENSMIIKNKYI